MLDQYTTLKEDISDIFSDIISRFKCHFIDFEYEEDVLVEVSLDCSTFKIHFSAIALFPCQEVSFFFYKKKNEDLIRIDVDQFINNEENRENYLLNCDLIGKKIQLEDQHIGSFQFSLKYNHEIITQYYIPEYV
jgi:hypothetical protein